MQTMFRLPWSADSCAEKPALDRVAPPKARPLPSPVDFMAKLKRARPSSSPPRSPDHAHLAKKLKGSHHVLQHAHLPSDSVPVADIPLTPTEPASHAVSPFSSVADAALGAGVATVDNYSDSPCQAAAPAVQNPTQAGSLGSGNNKSAYNEQVPSQMFTPGQSPSSSSIAPATAMPSTQGKAATRPQVTRYQVQQVIRLQMDQAILFKHDELRCIEQELAKCQIALEQIRRCQLIPYPSGRSVSEMTDKAMAPPQGYAMPESAAPWGVTDGPYSRHYAHWLIPDPKFDAVPIHAQPQASSRFESLQNASMRSSRSSRACNSIYSPTVNAPDAPRRDPMIMKRKADGRWVRLFDHVCNRGDYRNVQGFMNHCRMSHKEDLVDHEGAAKAYGIPLSEHEVAELGLENDPQRPQLPAPRKSTAAPIVAPAAPIAPIATPVAASVVSASTVLDKAKEERGRSLVHPLIHSAPAEKTLPKDLVDILYPPTPVSRPSSQTATPTNARFVPSAKMPHLSSILQKRGSSLNMKELVAEASERIDLDSVIPLPIDDGTLPNSKLHRKAPVATSASMRPQVMARHPASPTPFAMESIRPGALEIPESPNEDAELSPSTAADGNPGLVSDHDDAEEDDEFMQDDLLTQSREKHPVRVADGGDAMDEDVTMMDIDAGKGRSSKMR